MKKKYVSRLLAGCLTVTMLTPTGALASVPQPVVTQEASQAGRAGERNRKQRTGRGICSRGCGRGTDRRNRSSRKQNSCR